MQTGYPCPYCGFTDHPEDANYCGKCGKPIKFWRRRSFLGEDVGFEKNVDLSDLRPYEDVYLRKLYQFLQNPKNEDREFIGSPYWNPTEISPKDFKVWECEKLGDLENRYERLLTESIRKQTQILEARKFIFEERRKNGKIFGRKSRSEILNELIKILS